MIIQSKSVLFRYLLYTILSSARSDYDCYFICGLVFIMKTPILISLYLYSVKNPSFVFYTTLNNILLPSHDSLPQNVISRSSIVGLRLASRRGLAPEETFGVADLIDVLMYKPNSRRLDILLLPFSFLA